MKNCTINVEDVVKNLFTTFPYVKYIALNPGVSEENELTWTTQWFFVGYLYEPVFTVVDGWWSWAYDMTVTEISEDVGCFYLHMRSDVLLYNGEPLQTEKYKFANVGELCWHMKDDGEIEQIIDERCDTQYIDDAVDSFKVEEEMLSKKPNAASYFFNSDNVSVVKNNSLSSFL